MKLTASILSLFAVVTVANAATTTTSEMSQMHEVLVSQTLGSLAFGGGASSGTTSPTTFGLTAGYNYQFMPGFMIGIQPSISYLKVGDAKTTSLGFLAGPTVNFPFTDKFDNAFFLFGGLGINYASVDPGTGTSVSSTNFQWGFEAGKRFEIVEHVVYRPSIKLLKTSSDTKMQFAFNILSLSAVF